MMDINALRSRDGRFKAAPQPRFELRRRKANRTNGQYVTEPETMPTEVLTFLPDYAVVTGRDGRIEQMPYGGGFLSDDEKRGGYGGTATYHEHGQWSLHRVVE